MNRLTKIIAGLIFVGACAGEASYVVETSPPPPRHEVVVYRPGHVWVQGHWIRDGRHWQWREGYYVRERPNYVYVQPRWERRNRGYVYIQGEWRPRGRVHVRRY